MINLFVNRPEHRYETENICRLFFPSEKLLEAQKPQKQTAMPADTNDNAAANSQNNDTEKRLQSNDIAVNVTFDKDDKDGKDGKRSGKLLITAEVFAKGERIIFSENTDITGDEKKDEKTAELAGGRCLYKAFSKICGFSPKWGILTGVRPEKLWSAKSEVLGKSTAEQLFRNDYLVSKEKIELCEKAHIADKRAAALSNPDSFSLYVSVPFCPSRCKYCSFVSHSIASAGKLVPDYVELLCKEIEATAKAAKNLGLKLSTVYFGGGTPTQFSAEQLDKVLCAVENSFNMSDALEYTVEAGRPDTVTAEKLSCLKSHGVGRISINPQTLSNAVLAEIGRKHTVEQFYEAFALAKKTGFDTVNTDIIAGLSGDTAEGFFKTLEGIIFLDPENITVHTLSMKRSSSYVSNGEGIYSAKGDAVSDMVIGSSKMLEDAGFSPYYLYRQSKCLGNHENVGWSKEGHDCLYNIYMMNEVHSVLAVGAGAVSRLKDPFGNHIERIFNFKYPYEYINRFDEILKRKERIGEFYERYPV